MNVIRQKIKYFLNQFFASPLSSWELSSVCFNRQIEIIDDVTIRVTLMNTQQLPQQYDTILLPLIEKLCGASATLACMMGYPGLQPNHSGAPWYFTIVCSSEATMEQCIDELNMSIVDAQDRAVLNSVHDDSIAR